MEIEGLRFGRLVAVKRNPKGRIDCVCDCGQTSNVYVSALTKGHTKSCGCLRHDVMRQTGRRKTHGQTGKWAYTLVSKIKDRARIKGLEFDLSWEDVVAPDVCPVLGIPVSKELSKEHWPTVDRIDNTRGYTRDNIRVISNRANRIKSDASIEELEAIVEYIKANSEMIWRTVND